MIAWCYSYLLDMAFAKVDIDVAESCCPFKQGATARSRDIDLGMLDFQNKSTLLIFFFSPFCRPDLKMNLVDEEKRFDKTPHHFVCFRLSLNTHRSRMRRVKIIVTIF